MTQLVVINPPFIEGFSRYSRSPCRTLGGTLYYPLMEIIATGLARKNEIRVDLIDSVADKDTHKRAIERVVEQAPELVIVPTSTPSAVNDIEFASSLKDELPRSIVALVGRHASWAPEETLQASKADCVLHGEYYQAMLDILQGKKFKAIDGITYRESREITTRQTTKYMDPKKFFAQAPIIKEFLDVDNYFYASLKNPYIMLQHGFGCPFNCAFCNELTKSSYRVKRAECTILEMDYIEREMPQVKEILFDDPTFVVREEDTVKLCDMMIEAGVKITWSCNIRANVSKPTLEKMVEAGCRLGHVGIESLSQAGKNSINKGMTLEREEQFLYDAQNAGMLIHGCFIIGLPGDTKASIRETIEKAKKLPMDTAQIFPIIPTPGTSTFKWAEENGYLTSRNYTDWLYPDGSYRCVVSRPDLTSEEIEQFIQEFLKEYYYRPSYMWYKFKQSIRSWGEMKRNFRSFRNMMGKMDEP